MPNKKTTETENEQAATNGEAAAANGEAVAAAARTARGSSIEAKLQYALRDICEAAQANNTEVVTRKITEAADLIENEKPSLWTRSDNPQEVLAKVEQQISLLYSSKEIMNDDGQEKARILLNKKHRLKSQIADAAKKAAEADAAKKAAAAAK